MSDGQFIEGLHKEGEAISADDQHIAVFAEDGSGNYEYLQIGDNGGLKVDIVDATGITVEVDIDQYVDGYTLVSGEQGTVAMGSDGTNLQFINVDSSGTIAIQDNGGSITVDASSLDIRPLTSSDVVAIADGANALTVESDGSINVNATSSEPSQEIEYGTQAVAKAANATIVSYSPSATEKIKGIEVSALGYSRWEVQYGTTASETVRISKWTTPSNPSLFIDLEGLPIQSTETILVQGYNENNRPGNMNMYASIRHDA